MRAVPHLEIADALHDRQLLGACLGDRKSWSMWASVLQASFGNRLDESQRRLFRQVAGGRQPPEEPVSELWAICGRRSGKSRMAAAVACFIAKFIDHRDKLAPGEIGYILCLSPSLRQSRLVYNYCWSFLTDSPVLRQEIISCTAEEVRLKGNIVISTHPSSFRSVRGRTLLAVIFDESAFWRDETSALPDREVYSAVLPALATTNGMLIGISTPYRRTGLLYQKFAESFGKDDASVLVVRGATRLFNPLISDRVIATARKADPEAALAEWDAEFRSDLSALLPDEVIEAAIDHHRPLELPPASEHDYLAFTDASGGRHDAFTICIGHRTEHGDEARFVCDVLRGRHPPFDPNSVAREYVELCKQYRIRKVTGDAYGGEWVATAFKNAGALFDKSDLPKSGLYLEALPFFMRQAVSIPNHPKLIRELRLLERRVHRSGKDSVDHGVGGSDDFANALAGAMRVSGIGKREEKVSVAVIDLTTGRIGPDLEFDGQTPARRPPAMPTLVATPPVPVTSHISMMAQRDPKHRETIARFALMRRQGRSS